MPDVTVLPDDVHVVAGEDETILIAVTTAGYRYRYGCRRGGCSKCKLQLVLGEVRYERPIAESVLSDEEQVEGVCLSCRAVPITNIVVELQEGDRLRLVLPYGFAFPASKTATGNTATSNTAASNTASSNSSTSNSSRSERPAGSHGIEEVALKGPAR